MQNNISNEDLLRIAKQRNINVKSMPDISNEMLLQQAQKRGIISKGEPQKPYLQRAAEAPPTQFVLGMQRGTTEPYVESGNILNRLLGLPEMQAPVLGKGAAYETGRVAGQMAGMAPFMMAGGVGLRAAQALPGIGGIARAVAAPTIRGTAARGALGGAGMGALLSPKDRLSGALGGTILGGTLGTLFPATKAIFAKGPKTHMNEILNYLGENKSATENTNSLIQDIKTDAENIKSQYVTGLKKMEDQVGDYNLYEAKTGLAPKTYEKEITDLELTPREQKNMLGDVMHAHETFVKNPTFTTAHTLQSELGRELRSIKGIEEEARIKRNRLRSLRNATKTDIATFLDKQDLSGDLSNKYKWFSDFYLDNYIPYKNTPVFKNIVSPIKDNPKTESLLNAFKKPIPAGEDEAMSAADKIATNLGTKGRNKILYGEVKKTPKLTPKKLDELFDDLKTSNLETYFNTEVHPEFRQKAGALKSALKLKKQKIAVGAGLAGLGLLGSVIHPISLLKEVV